MAYGEDEQVVREVKLSVEDADTGDYVKLRGDLDDREGGREEGSIRPPIGCGRPLCYWIKLISLFACFALLAVLFLKLVGPVLLDKELIPFIKWERRVFSREACGALLFASVAFFPTILLPSSPSMWIVGMTFGYGYGFLLIISAATIGVSLPFLIGHLFRHKIQGWLENYPKKAAILKAAGEGDGFHQFRAVTLIRISPFPYMLYNYCAVATGVKYGPYILGSMVGILPDIFLSIYTGIMIRTIADASDEQQSLSASQIILNVVGFIATLATAIICTEHAMKKLKKLQVEEEPLLQ